MLRWLLTSALLSLAASGGSIFSGTITNQYSLSKAIPIGGSDFGYVAITGAPANAIITNVEVKFDYIAYGVVQNYVSVRFNRGADPGSYGGILLVPQGALPAGNPGTYGFVSLSNWNGQSVNTNYYFRFFVAAGSPYTATINTIYARITYSVPAPPNPPSLLSPYDRAIYNRNTTGTITFQWSSSAGANEYWLNVFPAGQSSNPVFNASVGNTTSRSIGISSFSNGEYVWQVRAGNGTAWGGYSTARNFITDTPPPAPSAVSPGSGASYALGSTAGFSWNPPAGGGIARYYLRIVPGSDLNNTPEREIAELTGTSRSETFDSPPYSGGAHAWGVRAIKTTPAGYNATTYESVVGWGPYSTPRALSLTVPIPNPPSLAIPSDRSIYNRNTTGTISFQWSASSGATEYWLNVFPAGQSATPVFNGSVGGATTYNLSMGLFQDAEYVWQVRAGNATGWSVYSGSRSFICDTPPTAPTAVSPSDGGAVMLGSSTTFSWNPPSGGGIARYYLRVVPGSDLNNAPEREIAELTGTSRAETFDSPPYTGGNHTWAVRAIKVTPSGYNSTTYESVIGWGPYSTPRSLNLTIPPPDPPAPLAPADHSIYNRNSGGTIAFQWSASSGASEYWLNVFPAGQSGNPVFDGSVGSATTHALSMTGFLDGEYVWQVRAGNGTSWGSYGTARSFITDTPPPAPVALGPSDGSIYPINGSATFSWDPPAGPGIARYYLRVVPGIDLNNAPEREIPELTGITRSETFDSPPYTTGLHSWGVRAIKTTPVGYDPITYESTVGWGPYTATRSLTLAAPALLSASQAVAVRPTRSSPLVIYALPDLAEYAGNAPFEDEKNAAVSFKLQNTGGMTATLSDWGVYVSGGVSTGFRVAASTPLTLAPGEESPLFDRRLYLRDDQLLNASATTYTAQLQTFDGSNWSDVAGASSVTTFTVQPRPAMANGFLVKRPRSSISVDPNDAIIYYHQNQRKWRTLSQDLDGLVPGWGNQYYVYPYNEIGSLISPTAPSVDPTIPQFTGRNLLYQDGVDIYILEPEPGASATWQYPTDPYLPGSYDGRSFYYDGDHLGEDVALPEGTPIHAIADGIIRIYQPQSDPTVGYGELVAVLEHDLGSSHTFTNAYGNDVETDHILSIYGHIRDSQLRGGASTGLGAGSLVTLGQIIGYVNDDAHNGDGTEHLHMGIRLSDAATAMAQDPTGWFRGYEKTTTQGQHFAAASQVLAQLGASGGGSGLVSRMFLDEAAFFSYGYTQPVLSFEPIPFTPSQLSWIRSRYPIGSTISTCSVPSSFSLTSPADASALPAGTSSVTLAWQYPSGATAFDVYFGTAPSPPLYASDVPLPSLTVPTVDGTTYYWMVVAKNSCGGVQSIGGVWSITVAVCQLPGPFNLSMPQDGAGFPSGTNSVDLTWEPSSNADLYEVVLTSSSSPPSSWTQPATTKTVSVTDDSTYSWTVSATNNCGVTPTQSGTWGWTVAPRQGLLLYADRNNDGDYDIGEEVPTGTRVLYTHNGTTHESFTQSDGLVPYPSADAGDALYSQIQIFSQPSFKGDRGFAGSMFDLFVDSDRLDSNANLINRALTTAEAATLNAGGVVPVGLRHPVFAWNLVVAMDWVDQAYVDDLKTGLSRASDLLFNATDGYAKIGRVTIVSTTPDTSVWRDNADIRVWRQYVCKGQTDILHNADLLVGTQGFHVNLPSKTDNRGNTCDAGDPAGPLWPHMLVHELGHYLFGFWDEYMNALADEEAWFKYRLNPLHWPETPFSYGLMDSGYNGREFSSFTDYLSSYAGKGSTQITLQIGVYDLSIGGTHKPCWQHFYDRFDNSNGSGPARAECSKVDPTLSCWDHYERLAGSTTVYPDFRIAIKPPAPPENCWRRWPISQPAECNERTGPSSIPLTFPASGGTHEIWHKVDFPTTTYSVPDTTELTTIRANNTRARLGSLPGPGVLLSGFLEEVSGIRTLRLRLVADTALTSPPSATVYPDYGSPVMHGMLEVASDIYEAEFEIGQARLGLVELEATDVSGTTQTSTTFSIIDVSPPSLAGFGADSGALAAYLDTSSLIAPTSVIVIGSGDAAILPGAGLTLLAGPVSFALESGASAGPNYILNWSISPEILVGNDAALISLYRYEENTRDWVPVGDGGIPDGSVVSERGLAEGTYAVFTSPSVDSIPPAPIADLFAEPLQGSGSIRLSWTAPGDDDDVGTATKYLGLFNTEPITLANSQDSTAFAIPILPHEAGVAESFEVEVPQPNSLYYFVVTAQDEASNVSALSNVASTISLSTDTDTDGIPDAIDNCPSIINPLQSDQDDDGIGDLCDTCPTAWGDCTDNNACTLDACDPQGGCQHTAISCDDGNPCTDDDCDPLAGCVHTNNSLQCDDGNACTMIDTCSGGLCVGGAPPTEVCDGVDNDCDGSIDEGLGQSTCGLGTCQVTTDNCIGGIPQICTPGMPSTEVCDGLDNDCNGMVDEGLASMPTTCGAGVCAGNSGLLECQSGSLVDTCDPFLGATSEICNGMDDDCDGLVDEDARLLATLSDPVGLPDEYFGGALARLPDVDGDGVDDLLIGSRQDDVAGKRGAGSVILLSGASLTEIARLTHPLPEDGDHFGVSVAVIDDINSDHIPDIAVGADGDDTNRGTDTGSVSVFSGSLASGFQLLDLVEDPNGLSGRAFGYSVAGMGDLDNDGVGEILVGGRGSSSVPGSVTVLSGRTREVLKQLADPLTTPNDQFGYSVAGIEDIDGDTLPDFLVGAQGWDSATAIDTGSVLLFRGGADWALLRRIQDPDESGGALFGRSIILVPDQDGDGVHEVLIGAPGDPGPSNLTGMGSVSLFSGGTGAFIDKIYSPNGEGDSWFGYRLASIDDVDGDGVRDLLVGAPFANDPGGLSNVGRAWIFSGATRRLAQELTHPRPQAHDQFGIAVSGLGDIDGDAVSEVAVGALTYDTTHGDNAGAVFVFSGVAAENSDGAPDGGDICDADDDNDGVQDSLDCAPQNGSVSTPPGEVINLTVGAGSIQWDPQGQDVIYDVVSGLVSSLTASPGWITAQCLDSQLSATSFVDTQGIPPSGEAYFFLVRARNTCEVRSFGEGSAGVSRRLSPGCP